MIKITKHISFFLYILCILFVSSCSTEGNFKKAQTNNMYKGMSKYDKNTLYISASNVESPLNESLVKHDMLNIGVDSVSQIINPYYIENESDFQIVSSIWEPLMKIGTDGEFIPNILKCNPTVSEDKKTYLFCLKEDLKWQDGSYITTEDIEFTYKFLMSKNYDGSFKRDNLNLKGWKDFRDSITDNIIGLEILDKYNFRVIVDNPNIYTLDLLNIYPLSSKYYIENENILNYEPFGNGLFKFLGLRSGEYIVLESNEFYFKGKTNIKNITFKAIDKQNALEELKKGNVDFVSGVTLNNENVKHIVDSEFLSAYSFSDYSYSAIGINHNNPILGDLNIRKAINLAINKKRIVFELFDDNVGISNIPIDKRSSNLFVKENFSEDFYNKNQAIKILEMNGWKKKNSIIREKNGNKLEFNILFDEEDKVNSKIFSILKENLESIGISVKAKYDNYNNLSENKKFDLIFMNRKNTYNKSFINSFFTNNKENIYGYSNFELDEVLSKIKSEFDILEIENLYNQVYEIVREEIVIIPLFQESRFDVYNGRIKGINSVNPDKTFYLEEIILKK